MQKEFTKAHSNMAKGLAILLLLAYHLFGEKETLVSMGVNHAPFSQEGFLRFSGLFRLGANCFLGAY